ncbi:transcriptional regulator [Flagellimonas sp. 2504JD1-5]
MIAVLTGDIKNSTEHKVQKWMPLLKQALNRYGNEPAQWEIYRGDSFQLEVVPEKAMEAAIYIKACLKQLKGIDVRMGIGIGKKDYSSEKITESNGTAFVNSGKCFESLKKQNLGVKSANTTFDEHINLLLELALLTMDDWTPAISKTVKSALENPEMNQKELGSIFNKSQGNISEELNKAGFDEVKKMIQFYTTQLTQL